MSGGRETNDLRSIYHAAAIVSGAELGIRAESNGSDAVRLEVISAWPDAHVRLIISNEWNHRNLGLGDYMKKPVIVRRGYTNRVGMRLTEDTGN